MSVLAPVLTQTIGMTNAQYALVAQGFLVSYTVAFLLGGLVIDKLGVCWGLGASIFFWSIANALHALANTPHELAAFRFLLRVAYPAAFVAAARAVSEWCPAPERALVYGISVSGATFGAMVAFPSERYPGRPPASRHFHPRHPFALGALPFRRRGEDFVSGVGCESCDPDERPSRVQAVSGGVRDRGGTLPLPSGHPFYRLENVLLSPHCADHTPGFYERDMEFFMQNLQRFLSGEPLRNVVDKEAGY
jgi:hypothetical protein